MPGAGELLSAWAGRHGWQRHPEAGQWQATMNRFWRKAVVTGPLVSGGYEGLPVVVVAGQDRDVTESRRDHLVIAVAVPRALAPLILRPRGRIGIVTGTATGAPVASEDPAFDRRYRALSPTPLAARALLTRAVLDHLLQREPVPIEIGGMWITSYIRGRDVVATLDRLVPQSVELARVLTSSAGPE